MQRQMVAWYRYALASAWALMLGTTASWSQSLTWLGTLPGYDESFAYGVSANGPIVIGGTRIRTTAESRAFRWTPSDGMQDLGTLGGYHSWAYGISADGMVVVGAAQNADEKERAFRWTLVDGMQDLGTLPDYEFSSFAYGTSADGSVVVGEVYDPFTGSGRAFRWTPSGGMEDLGTLGGYRSVAYSVSADGSVVVGWSYDENGYYRAFRWTPTTGMVDLGTLGGESSWAWAVSADGTIVVGWTTRVPRGHPRAFRWTLSGGMEDLNMTYARLLSDDSVLLEAVAISPDGRYIVGRGLNGSWLYQAYLLDTLCIPHSGDVNNDGCIDDTDLLAVLFASGETGQDLGRIDVNCDGVVDDSDMLTILFNLGSGCE